MTEYQAQAVRIGDTVSRVAAGRIRQYTVTGVRVGLITDDGFAPHAIVVDTVTGCWDWQGSLSNGRTPQARYLGRNVNVRRLAYERAGKPLAPGRPLVTTCRNARCVNPHHATTLHRPAPPKGQRKPRLSPRRQELIASLPTTRPASISEREWLVLRAVAGGRILVDVGRDLGVTRQRIHDILHRARRKLPARISPGGAESPKEDPIMTTTTATTIPADWDADNPDTWVLSTTVDAHLGYHPTGAVLREYRDIRYAVADYTAEPLDGEADTPANRREAAQWWADTLGPIFAAAVAIAEASPERTAAAAAALGIDPAPGGGIDLMEDGQNGDLRDEAHHAQRVTAALARAAR